MKAKEYLQQVGKLNKIIENKTAEIEQWKMIAKSTGTFSNGERVQSSGNPEKMADAVVNYSDIEAELLKSRQIYIMKKQEVVHTIEQLPAIEYDVLHKLYIGVVETDLEGRKFIKYLFLEDVADLYSKSYSWATTVHGRALKAVQDILDRKEKCREEMQNLWKDV